jgi:hypothetical protein
VCLTEGGPVGVYRHLELPAPDTLLDMSSLPRWYLRRATPPDGMARRPAGSENGDEEPEQQEREAQMEAVVDAACGAWNALLAEAGRLRSLTSFPWLPPAVSTSWARY